jgi:hypothetical protein
MKASRTVVGEKNMAVRTKPKRKPAKRATPRRRAKPAATAENRLPAPAPAPARRRKLVNWDTGAVYRNATTGEVVTWPPDDNAAEVVLLAQRDKHGGLWSLVPVAYQFVEKGPEGRVWR